MLYPSRALNGFLCSTVGHSYYLYTPTDLDAILSRSLIISVACPTIDEASSIFIVMALMFTSASGVLLVELVSGMYNSRSLNILLQSSRSLITKSHEVVSQ